jgi:hypothetical protein
VKSAGSAAIPSCVHSLIDMEHAIMQQSVPDPFQYVASDTTSRPRRHVGVLRRIDHALDQLDWLAKRCLKALGQAYLDGLVAYGVAMHGFPPPIDEKTHVAPPTDASIWVDLSGTWLNRSPTTGIAAADSPFPARAPRTDPSSRLVRTKPVVTNVAPFPSAEILPHLAQLIFRSVLVQAKHFRNNLQ